MNPDENPNPQPKTQNKTHINIASQPSTTKYYITYYKNSTKLLIIALYPPPHPSIPAYTSANSTWHAPRFFTNRLRQEMNKMADKRNKMVDNDYSRWLPGMDKVDIRNKMVDDDYSRWPLAMDKVDRRNKMVDDYSRWPQGMYKVDIRNKIAYIDIYIYANTII